MKGSLFAWVGIMAMVFVVGFIWIVMSQAYVPILFPETETILSNYTDATSTMTTIENVWNYWPIITIFLLIIYGIVSVLRREPNTQYI